jgi:poly-gamma-glutamate synthesis protein (capsule biosynthesis protein)
MNRKTKISFLGDIAFSPSIVQQCGADSDLWKGLSIDGDLVVGNFEFPYSEQKIPYFDLSYLGHLAPEESLKLLADSPVNVYSIANNHIMDWGVEGLLKTKKILQSFGAQVFGAGMNQEEASKPVIIDHEGIKIGFLAYCKKGEFSATQSSLGAALLDKNIVCKKVRSLKASVDHVIVNLHWGVEFSDYPYPPDIEIAHNIIDSGASAIIGHHPHVVQGLEVYKGCPIFYSLGSFIYDPWAERVFVDRQIWERQHSIIAKICLSKSAVTDWEWKPYRVDRDCLWPTPVHGDGAAKFEEHFSTISKRIPQASKWFYEKAVDNLLKRELITIWNYTKKTKGRFLLQKIRDIRLRHMRILIGALLSKLHRFWA